MNWKILMKTIDYIILSLCIGFFVIALYETITIGLTTSYMWFMVSIGMLLYYSLRRRQREENDQAQDTKRKGR